MSLSFTNSWFGVIFNPVGYQAQHVSISEAARRYAAKNPPSRNISAETETEVTFTQSRQRWIDGCAGAIKGQDVGYSKANAERACAAKFDADGITAKVRNAIQQRAIVEKAEVQAKAEQNNKTALFVIIGFLLAGLLIYLFISK